MLAEVWDIALDHMDTPQMIETLHRAMLEPARSEMIWDTLGERERGALQALVSMGGKMPEAKFNALFGAIRDMGAAVAAKEQPHLNPATPAEALFYRGLIGRAYENASIGTQRIVFVPDDLIRALPLHKTSYDDLPEEDEDTFQEAFETLPALDDVTEIQLADTSLVDDLTTLLAYLQLNAPLLEGDLLSPSDGKALLPFLLGAERARLVFMLKLGIGADLIEIQNGRAIPKRAEARRWLGASRAEQVRRLTEVWRETNAYVDLWHVPGLYPEPEAGTMRQYNPAAARGAVFDIMKPTLPDHDWWSVEDFIDLVREDSADFQRPNSDFDSWYIRNDQGEYLTGIQSWDAVEGALLEFLITAPMHWLGLLDLGDDAARLTAYGRAFLGMTPYPTPPDPQDKIEVGADGALRVSRKVARIDRFQIARFATWLPPNDGVFEYRIDTQSIARAAAQGINTGHIAAFISRATGDAPLPTPLASLLNNWRQGAVATVQIERVLVLQTTSPEVMRQIMETPGLRRFMGRQLGDMAAIVRADDLRELRDALGEHGIQADIIGG